MNISIRPASASDLAAVMALEKDATTAAHWSAGQYQELFGASGSSRVTLVAQTETGLAGFVIARVLGEEWEIENIAIAGAARRQGLGSRLLAELLGLARVRGAAAIFLEVRESNHAARGLYEKVSFVQSGRRPKYYKDPEEDALLYRLVL